MGPFKSPYAGGYRGSLFYQDLLDGAIVEDDDVETGMEGGVTMAAEGVNVGGRGV